MISSNKLTKLHSPEVHFSSICSAYIVDFFCELVLMFSAICVEIFHNVPMYE